MYMHEYDTVKYVCLKQVHCPQQDSWILTKKEREGRKTQKERGVKTGLQRAKLRDLPRRILAGTVAEWADPSDGSAGHQHADDSCYVCTTHHQQSHNALDHYNQQHADVGFSIFLSLSNYTGKGHSHSKMACIHVTSILDTQINE